MSARVCLSRRCLRHLRHLRSVLLFVYFCLVGFALFNYKSHCVYTSPSILLNMLTHRGSNEGKCHVDLQQLDLVPINIADTATEDDIAASNPDLKNGGRWAPLDCQALQRVAVIVPYRDRHRFLMLLLSRLHPMLRRQKISYQIFVVEQFGDKQFNRGKLMNIGFLEAAKQVDFDCFIFQDADLLPESDSNLYLCDANARHLASAINEMRYHVMYYNYAGGVVGLSRENYLRVNGYSNSYWGWGNEDDDFSARMSANDCRGKFLCRILESGLLLSRPPEHIGRYKMLRHKKQTRSDSGNKMFLGWWSRWTTDGLSNAAEMNYTVMSLNYQSLFTHILVDIGPPPLEMRVGNSDEFVSMWWFLKFYFP